MNGKLAILATTSILTFGIAIPAYAQNDNLPAGSFRVAEDATAPKTMDSDPSMSSDEDMEDEAIQEDLETGDDDGAMGDAEMPGKTMESDPK
ncbi:hypothetical protein A7A08_02963 [Methyloligella halotolerans]|uniref:Pentapeptide MXKDX repeat protein n=1 Tax=Methyloligella halotolerans TaxID=1177755 RepID=A0A1E2RVG7_9HYPH|nr:hypothetical protein [Methyloligella halotolerans]ODA66110.1 hypothetical protein A7A08_02963 [Methyloligella halotolerans]